MDIYAIRKENLRNLMKGRKQSSCAEKWGTSASALSQIVSKRSVRNLGDDLARRIETAEGLEYGWLDRFHAEIAREPLLPQVKLMQDMAAHSAQAGNVRPGPLSFRHVPEISWVAAGCWTDVDECNVNLTDAPYWPCPVSCSENTFALRVEGDSMAPTFMPGTLIFVDPEVMPISGKKVVAIMTDTNQATFKQYIEDGGQKMLKALNPNWPQQYVPINGNCRIVGTVIFAGMEM
ncbi:LexA family transcriptional repressor [Halomonas shantousis]